MALPIRRGSRFPVSLFEPTALWDPVSEFEYLRDRMGLPTELPASYRQNCGGGLTLSMVPWSDTDAGRVLAGFLVGEWRCWAVVSLPGHA